MERHTFSWGPFVAVVATEGYDLYLHGTRVTIFRQSSAPAEQSLGALARAAIESAEQTAQSWALELPRPLPARARALMRWF